MNQQNNNQTSFVASINDYPKWTLVFPVVSVFLALALHQVTSTTLLLWLGLPLLALLLVNVFASVHHAETIALKIGNPYGSFVLAISVTIVEVAIILAVLLNSTEEVVTIARDTVFATIMIVLNGIIGFALLVGGLRFHKQEFKAPGAVAALSTLATIAVLTLVLPDFTTAIPGPVYAPPQLIMVATVSIVLYVTFLMVQMISHRDDFTDIIAEETHHKPPTKYGFIIACTLLPITLIAVILLAESLSPMIELTVNKAGLPIAMVGVVIAIMVLLPEGTAAIRAALNNRLQTSINLALGSALASICLTIPTVAMLTLFLDKPLALGLAGEHIVLLLLSLFVATITLAMGRTTILQGAIHLVIFAVYLMIASVP